MQTLITVSLNDFRFQVEEDGYKVLREYLERAGHRLSGNPDKDEILGDLERGIGEKCAALVTGTKAIVTSAEIAQVLEDVGPVDGAPSGAEAPAPPQHPKRLYRIGEGAVFGGVCTGLAAYLSIDIVLVRLIFVGLAIMTSGFGGLIAYLIMMLVIPYAPNSVQRPMLGGTMGIVGVILAGLCLGLGILILLRSFSGGMWSLGLPELLIFVLLLVTVLSIGSILISRSRSSPAERQ